MTEEEEKEHTKVCQDAKLALKLTDKYLQRMEEQVGFFEATTYALFTWSYE